MLHGFDTSLEERLRRAEEAEQELVRLQPLAAEAPKLRSEKAKLQRRQERERAKEAAMQLVHQSVRTAAEKQRRVPQLLEAAGKAVQELYVALRELDGHRRAAAESLAIVDRTDYEIEVEEKEEQEIAQDRDPRGLAYALASRHGDARVKALLEDLDPGFRFLKDCNLGEPLLQDVAKFVLGHAVASPEQEILAMAETQPIS